MKFKLQITVITLLAFTSLFGCSSGDVNGTYGNADGSQKITLTKDGKFIHPRLGGEYSVEDNNVIITVPMLGGTIGEVDGDNLIFSDKGSIVGRKLSGTWTKTE